MKNTLPFEFDLENYNFMLPEQLIAQRPVTQRSESRLLVLNRSTESITECIFNELTGMLPKDSLLVINNSKVFPARFQGVKEHTGGKVEFLLLTPLVQILQTISRLSEKQAVVQGLIRPAKNIKLGQLIHFGDNFTLRVIKKKDYGRIEGLLSWSGDLLTQVCQKGSLPLPPYIKREVAAGDYTNYQTVFARDDKAGSVAAPTAGLHFSDDLIESLSEQGILITSLTLYVGYGTFSPIRCRDIRRHEMHSEYYELSSDAARLINQAKKDGRKIVAVGTTTVRTLESIMHNYGSLIPHSGSTNLFIYPGFEFKVIDHMITNFHLPKSSLMLLVAAFAGHKQILETYQFAVQRKYRFFSYGDAMLIL